MQKTYTSVILLLFFSSLCYGQSIYQPYSYQFYQKADPVLYSPATRIHTSFKPYLQNDSTIKAVFDSLNNRFIDTTRRSWVSRKLFNEHLIQIIKPGYQLYADYLPDLQIGRETRSKTTTSLNTRGYQIGLNIGNKFTFYTSGFENEGVFAPYIKNFIDVQRVVPGQTVKDFSPTKRSVNYPYVSSVMSYSPLNELNFTLGYDKNFIGDGYRSLFLSDVSSNYTFFKATGTFGDIQYTSMWAYMLDPLAPKTGTSRGIASQRKWGIFQYLDWNVSRRLSIGLFQSVLWSPQNSDGTTRGFDFNYINPVIFLRPIESSDPNSPDKTHIGFSAKYKVIKSNTLYGQFLLDDFMAKEFFSGRGWWTNKWAAQIGAKGFNTFNVKNLSYLIEYNLARPYTYSHFQQITSYSNYSQPLAHPFGANFQELVSIWNYSLGRFDIQAQLNCGWYGLDENGLDYGKNIFIPYGQHVSDYGNYIGQGVKTSLIYTETKFSYMINPRYNLRLEAGFVYRKEKNKVGTDLTNLITIGLRSSFKNLYYDF
jgi:hypothetical protein